MMKPVPAAKDGFILAKTVPNDVFLFVAECPNPEREFLDHYWGEVFEALRQSGVGDDLMGLLSSVMGTKELGEVERLKERASQLVAEVDWGQLAGKENAFAERFDPPVQFSEQRPPIMLANMVWLSRGSGGEAAKNYQGLVAILEAIVEEVNKAVGAEALVVERGTQMGAKVTSVNMLAMAPGAPRLPLSVALRDDVVVIALREHLFSDVLGLMEGASQKKALSDDPRFKAAFAQLPPAEDTMTFFDMQALINPLRGFLDTVIGMASGPDDVTVHTGMSAEAVQLHAGALSAYRRGDIKQALDLTEQAQAVSPESSVLLYNLACFHALVGNKDQALAWLEKAVEGGFHAPAKIASDSDLVSLRGEPGYKAALSRAAELAWGHRARDVITNSSKTGEAYALLLRSWKVYQDKDYEQGLKFAEQAYAVAPEDSRVLYALGCFHALLGHENKALDFLAKAVEGGFYCPQHISKDPDWESLRGRKRYEAALAVAQKKSVGEAAGQKGGEVTMVKGLIDRLADAAGVLDYAATVETTEGYATWAESITVLAPDAKDRPIYRVFGKRRQLTDFDRYLPREAISFSVSSGVDLGELYKFIIDSIRLTGPKGEELLAKWTGLQKQFGVDVRKDALDWIDGETISVTLADGGGSVWLIKVTDEEAARKKVAAAIEFCSTNLGEIVAKNPAFAGLAMLGVRTSPAEHEGLEGFQNLHFAMSPQPAVWGITDGYLVFGTSANAAASCLATAKGDHPNIRDNARAMSEAIVPTGPFASVSLADRRGLGDEVATGLGIASMVYGMMGAAVPDPKVRPVLAKLAGMLAKLTPVVRKIDFYKSAATHTTFDGQAWRVSLVTHYASPEERATK